MQILYAAPFLVSAAIVYFLCLLPPLARRHALVVPVGILSFGFGALFAFLVEALVTEKLGRKSPATWADWVVSITGGLLISLVCSIIFRQIVSILAIWFVQCGLVAASFCSSVTLMAVCSALVQTYGPDMLKRFTIETDCALLVATAWLSTWLVRRAELFRPLPLHMTGTPPRHSS